MGSITRMAVPVVVGLLGAACGGADPAADGGEDATTISVVGTGSLRFEPDELRVPAGEAVTVELTAEGVEHDFVVEDAADVGVAEAEESEHGAHGDHGDEGDEAAGGDDLHVVHADAGSTQRSTLTIDEPGTYTVYCEMPGHRAAGMEATLEVVESTA